ncbi:YciI family protein [Rhodophyticola porphyridii]|uniref:YciI family protein n=1 Tax=Rhodophyticola porphyridii TaxID=1852017 RepID=UPI0035CEC5E2
MQYIIMNYTPPADHPDADAVKAAADGELWGAYTRALVDAGILVGGEALHPSHTATTLRMANGQREVQDGPYAATKEQLGGFYVIDVPDLDAALEWAARNPAASSGAVEVRPVIMRDA